MDVVNCSVIWRDMNDVTTLDKKIYFSITCNRYEAVRIKGDTYEELPRYSSIRRSGVRLQRYEITFLLCESLVYLWHSRLESPVCLIRNMIPCCRKHVMQLVPVNFSGRYESVILSKSYGLWRGTPDVNIWRRG